MARKKKHPGHENHERWLVSYADFITLMFAFFVVMFASSQADKGKAQQVSESVRRALEEGQVGTLIASILGGAKGEKGPGNAMMRGPGGTKVQRSETPTDGRIAELLPSLEHLARELKFEIEAGQMKLDLQKRGLIVSLQQAAFFPSGEDAIDPRMLPAIQKVADAIRGLGNPVRLEGHTDAVPIHNSRFRSNWELSAARSIAMLELLATRCNIPRERMSIAGYAETAPVSDNETDIGRARNRRVDIVILSAAGVSGEPTKPSPAPVAGY
jgi:chemotaxis protein MotB